jgi:hypothetical protein
LKTDLINNADENVIKNLTLADFAAWDWTNANSLIASIIFVKYKELSRIIKKQLTIKLLF